MKAQQIKRTSECTTHYKKDLELCSKHDATICRSAQLWPDQYKSLHPSLIGK